MADDVDIKIKLGSDLSGGVQTREELQRVKSKARDMEMGIKASSKGASDAMNRLERSVGLVRKVMTGFGVGFVFTQAIEGIAKIAGSFEASRQKAEEFRKAAEAKALAASIRDLADAYGEMKAAMADAAQIEQNQLEIIDQEVKARRELAAAKLDAAEQAELAAIDGNSETAAEQRGVVAAKYAKLRGLDAASNRVEDLQLERQRQDAAAARADKEASAAADNAQALRKKAKEIRGKAAGEDIASTAPNAKDKQGFLGYVGGQLRDIVKLNWGNLGNWQTPEGDAEREAHRKNKEALEDQAESLEKQAREYDAEAKAKREEAEQSRRRKAATDVSLEAAHLAQDTTRSKGVAGEGEARTTLTKKVGELAARDEERAAARATIASAGGREADLRAREKAAHGAYANVEAAWVREQLEANDAKLAYDHVRSSGGGRRELEAAYANLKKEQREAEEARAKMEAAATNLATTLKGINESLNALSRSVNQAKSRLSAAKEDA